MDSENVSRNYVDEPTSTTTIHQQKEKKLSFGSSSSSSVGHELFNSYRKRSDSLGSATSRNSSFSSTSSRSSGRRRRNKGRKRMSVNLTASNEQRAAEILAKLSQVKTNSDSGNNNTNKNEYVPGPSPAVLALLEAAATPTKPKFVGVHHRDLTAVLERPGILGFDAIDDASIHRLSLTRRDGTNAQVCDSLNDDRESVWIEDSAGVCSALENERVWGREEQREKRVDVRRVVIDEHDGAVDGKVVVADCESNKVALFISKKTVSPTVILADPSITMGNTDETIQIKKISTDEHYSVIQLYGQVAKEDKAVVADKSSIEIMHTAPLKESEIDSETREVALARELNATDIAIVLSVSNVVEDQSTFDSIPDMTKERKTNAEEENVNAAETELNFAKDDVRIDNIDMSESATSTHKAETFGATECEELTSRICHEIKSDTADFTVDADTAADVDASGTSKQVETPGQDTFERASKVAALVALETEIKIEVMARTNKITDSNEYDSRKTEEKEIDSPVDTIDENPAVVEDQVDQLVHKGDARVPEVWELKLSRALKKLRAIFTSVVGRLMRVLNRVYTGASHIGVEAWQRIGRLIMVVKLRMNRVFMQVKARLVAGLEHLAWDIPGNFVKQFKWLQRQDVEQLLVKHTAEAGVY